MAGISDLDSLLQSISPVLLDDEFVFCIVQGKRSEYLNLQVSSFFYEAQGLTLILPASEAE